MEFFLVDVKSITPPLSIKQADKTQIKQLAESILECNGLIKPLVLKQTGPETYAVISGHTGYYAALKAREIDPRKGEMVNAFVIPPNAEESVTRQLKALELCR